jgi:hypothetical protein
MALTLITNPVGTDASKIFAGFLPVEFIFKREDLSITSVTAGTGGAKITHAGDLTSYLSEGDTIYLYSIGTGYTYNITTDILSIVAGEITVDASYIVSGTGGYINYFKNYYVELQCVNPSLSDVNLLPFSLQSDGDMAGNIRIDVSIVNELNLQRGVITEGLQTASVQQFEVKYRQVYVGSAESFTLIDNKLIILLYATETPDDEVILNSFTVPKLFLGYPGALTISNLADVASSTIQLNYNELDINKNTITSGLLSAIASDVNGFLLWKWPANASLNQSTKFVEFDFSVAGTFDFKAIDFAYPDFKTQ